MIAFDTNILVYANQSKQDRRHEIAKNIISKAIELQAIIPVQVLGELLNVCRTKLKLTSQASIEIATDYIEIFDCPATIAGDLAIAADLAELSQLQFFDALIITVAARNGATILLSEDMHDGLEINGLKIVNPFVASNEALLAEYFSGSM